MSDLFCLRFGIPSLDSLFHYIPGEPEKWGIGLPRPEVGPGEDAVTSLCIAGPSGTGKSLLGLHLASRYYADCAGLKPWKEIHHRPTIIFVSTDLTFNQARTVWSHFALHRPNLRGSPYISEQVSGIPADDRAGYLQFHPSRDLHIELRDCSLREEAELVRHLELPADYATGNPEGTPGRGEVLFLNLAESTAGDDWSFVTKLVSLLRPAVPGAPRHMLIVDAVEGLEMMVGNRDAHGTERTRRSRIAQLLRCAVDKCHVALILEEKSEHDDLPEEFVTDAVLRMRSAQDGQYQRRTVEVVKSRGQSSVRGVHHYIIRRAQPRRAGEVTRPDEPPVTHPDDPERGQSYIQVFHSLHCLTRRSMQVPEGGDRPERQPVGVAPFAHPRLPGILPHNGLPAGRVTILTGDEATTKGRLARAFLAGAFQAESPEPPDEARREGDEIAVLLSTSNFSLDDILQRLACHGTLEEAGAGDRATRFIYRQLEVHDLGSAVLFHIIRRCVEQALRRAMELEVRHHPEVLAILRRIAALGPKPAGPAAFKRWSDRLDKIWVRAWSLPPFLRDGVRRVAEAVAKTPPTASAAKRWKKDAAWWEQFVASRLAERRSELDGRNWWDWSLFARRVRLVIDDWSVIQTIYPAVAGDSLFLPFLIRYLEGVGITALIVETQVGRPGDLFRIAEAGRHLRSLAGHHLFTWHVPFYGDDRVAITAIPPLKAGAPSPVAELRSPRRDELSDEEQTAEARGQWIIDERLIGDPHFELYGGLETGALQPVGLSVRLFASAEGFAEYARRCNEILAPVFPPSGPSHAIVEALEAQKYASVREFAFLGTGTRVEHTVVFTVDEYWPAEGPAATNPVAPYLSQQTVDDKGRRRAENDPYQAFQPDATAKDLAKKDFFLLDHVYGRDSQLDEGSAGSGGRREDLRTIGDDEWHKAYDQAGLVPYVWDFGFLLLDGDAWQGAASRFPGQKVPLAARDRKTIERVWTYCTSGWSVARPAEITWRDFLLACRSVAKFHGGHLPILRAETSTVPTLVCLVLEMWFSEIAQTETLSGPGCRFSETRLPGECHPASARTLTALLMTHRDEFFRIWLLLGEVMKAQDALDAHGNIRVCKNDDSPAIATRHWYSTASRYGTRPSANAIPARLPGLYSTRGDWFLAIGQESRSLRLGERAIDFLSRRRANLTRLELGIGLPTRDILYDHARLHQDEEEKRKRYAEIDTAVFTRGDGGVPRPLTYQELRELGAPFPWKREMGSFAGSELRWLWRSQIVRFHRHDRILERWVARFLQQASRWASGFAQAGSSGFEVYDQLSPRRSPPLKPLPPVAVSARQRFDEMLAVMDDELRKLTPSA